MTTSEPNARRYSRRCRQRRMARRRNAMVIMAILAVLATVFALGYMDSLGLELNEKTQIFPIRNGIDFLGFHTYLTESGKVIRKLRHSSIKRMRAKLRHWEKEYPAGLVTREQILQSWQAWDAHASHGNTWALRQQVRDRVQNILKEEI